MSSHENLPTDGGQKKRKTTTPASPSTTEPEDSSSAKLMKLQAENSDLREQLHLHRQISDVRKQIEEVLQNRVSVLKETLLLKEQLQEARGVQPNEEILRKFYSQVRKKYLHILKQLRVEFSKRAFQSKKHMDIHFTFLIDGQCKKQRNKGDEEQEKKEEEEKERQRLVERYFSQVLPPQIAQYCLEQEKEDREALYFWEKEKEDHDVPWKQIEEERYQALMKRITEKVFLKHLSKQRAESELFFRHTFPIQYGSILFTEEETSEEEGEEGTSEEEGKEAKKEEQEVIACTGPQ